MPLTSLAVALALAGCGDSTASKVQPAPSRTDAVLTIGQDVLVDSVLRVAVIGVPADSRCPTSVQCVWAGDGAVAITHSLGDGPSLPDTLHTTIDPKSVRFGGYLITLLDLTPHPSRPGPIPAEDYTVRLRVERLPD